MRVIPFLHLSILDSFRSRLMNNINSSLNHTEKTAEAEPLSNAKNKAPNNLAKILASFAGHCGVRHIRSLKSLNSRPAFFN